MKIRLKGTQEEIEKWFFVNVGLGKLKDFKVVSSKIRKEEDNHEIIIDTGGEDTGTTKIELNK